ncbi:ribonuclease H, partial [Trifolium pratense]
MPTDENLTKRACTTILTSINLSSQLLSSKEIDFRALLQLSTVHSSAAWPASTLLVLWQTPSVHWMKANTDGSVVNMSAASGGLFRDYMANFCRGFAQNISGVSVLHDEIVALILAMELAHKNKWHYLWVESDCVATISAFDNINIVPWDLRNRWSNCLHLHLTMRWSHIYGEGNACADKFATLGHMHTQMRWWGLPSVVRDNFL